MKKILMVMLMVMVLVGCDRVTAANGRSTYNLPPGFTYVGDCPGTYGEDGYLGMTDHVLKTVCVQDGMPAEIQSSVLAHELGHAWAEFWQVNPNPYGWLRWDNEEVWADGEQLAWCAASEAGAGDGVWVIEGRRYSVHMIVRCTDQWRSLGAELAFWMTATPPS